MMLDYLGETARRARASRTRSRALLRSKRLPVARHRLRASAPTQVGDLVLAELERAGVPA